jgi:hypothetical protein
MVSSVARLSLGCVWNNWPAPAVRGSWFIAWVFIFTALAVLIDMAGSGAMADGASGGGDDVDGWQPRGDLASGKGIYRTEDPQNR